MLRGSSYWFLSCYFEWQTFFQILNLETQITRHAKNCFPASSKIRKSWFDLVSPWSLFNQLTNLEKRKLSFSNTENRLFQSADEPSLTYLPQLEKSLLKKGNEDCESSKNSRLQQRCTGCLPHFQLLLQASEFPGTKASDTHRRNQKRGVGTMWFASSSWITAYSSASS